MKNTLRSSVFFYLLSKLTTHYKSCKLLTQLLIWCNDMSKSMIFSFGRFNPPTLGHQHLLNLVIETAIKHNADHSIFLSRTQNAKKDPLDWDFKNRILKIACPNANIVDDIKVRTPFEALEKIANDGYKTVIFIAGDDRIKEFEQNMSPYAVQWGIEDFKVLSSGPRNHFAKDLSGISANRLRSLAMQSRLEEFRNDLPTGLTEALQLEIYCKIRETCIQELYCGIV